MILYNLYYKRYYRVSSLTVQPFDNSITSVHVKNYKCGLLQVTKLNDLSWMNNAVVIFCENIIHVLHFSNGLPVKPFGQKQTGLPLSFSHNAFKPHGFGTHGSEVNISWQPMLGFPWNPGRHVHCA